MTRAFYATAGVNSKPGHFTSHTDAPACLTGRATRKDTAVEPLAPTGREPISEYLTTRQVCEMLHCGRVSVNNYIQCGLLPSYQLGGNHYVLRQTVLDYIDGRRGTTRIPPGRHCPPEERDAILGMYARGWPMDVLSIVFCRDAFFVQTLVKSAGLTRPMGRRGFRHRALYPHKHANTRRAVGAPAGV